MGKARTTWASHRLVAWAIRAIIFLIPIVFGLLVSWTVVRSLDEPQTAAGIIGWWVAVIGSAILSASAADRLLRRVTPITMLLGLTLAFPDKAPSRFSVMLRSFTVRGIARDVDSGILDESPDLKSASEELLGLLARLTAHDPQTRGHAERVRAYSDLVAEEIGLGQIERDKLRWGALLHDIGKIAVPRSVLNKQEQLDDTDWLVIRNHPLKGEALTQPLAAWLGDWRLTVGEHHERWDGTGYPFGLSGKDISLGARIVSVCDAFDAMTSYRAYGNRLGAEEARAEIAVMSGMQFDPSVVRALMRVSIGRLRAPIGIWAWLPAIPFSDGLERLARQTSVVAAAVVAVVGFASLPTPEPVVEVAGITIEQIAQAEPAPATTVAPPPTTSAPTTTTSTSTTTTSSAEAQPAVVAPVATTSTTTTSTTSSTTTTTVPVTTTTTTPPPPPQPVAPILVLSVGEDGTISFSLGSVGTVAITTPPTMGTVNLNPDGTGTYVPDADAYGTDSFGYQACLGSVCTSGTVTINIAAANDAPVTSSDLATTDSETPVTIDVLANDTDPDGDTLTVTNLVQPASGVATTDGTSITFDPLGTVGEIPFSYTVCDPDGICATGDVIVTVDPAPTTGVADDEFTLTSPRASSFDPLANDSLGPEPYDITILSEPEHGKVSVLGNNKFQYKPRGFIGTTFFVYQVCDANGVCSSGTVTVTVE